MLCKVGAVNSYPDSIYAKTIEMTFCIYFFSGPTTKHFTQYSPVFGSFSSSSCPLFSQDCASSSIILSSSALAASTSTSRIQMHIINVSLTSVKKSPEKWKPQKENLEGKIDPSYNHFKCEKVHTTLNLIGSTFFQSQSNLV